MDLRLTAASLSLPHHCTASIDREKNGGRESLNHFHDYAVGLVGDDLGQDVEAADHLAELAFEAQVRYRAGAFVGEQVRLALGVTAVGKPPDRDLHVARGVVEALRIEVVEDEELGLVAKGGLDHAAHS